MKLFLDSAHINELQHAFDSGIVDGITTNPSLMKKAMDSIRPKPKMNIYINKILKLAGKLPVSLEVKGGTADQMFKQANLLWKRFAKKSNNVVIKIPFDPTHDKPLHYDGLKVIKRLASKRIPVNVTLIFTPEQALLAAKAGATYVSPFAGRVDDFIRSNHRVKFAKSDYFPAEGMVKGKSTWEDNGVVSGVDLVAQIRSIFDNYGFATQILAASLRNARQVREVALAGADVATVPPALIEEMIVHFKSQQGMQNFLKDTVSEYEKLMR